MMTLITINRVYYLIGFVVMLLVVMTLRDRANPKRFTTALFWFLFGGIFLFGDLMVQELGKSLAYSTPNVAPKAFSPKPTRNSARWKPIPQASTLQAWLKDLKTFPTRSPKLEPLHLKSSAFWRVDRSSPIP